MVAHYVKLLMIISLALSTSTALAGTGAQDLDAKIMSLASKEIAVVTTELGKKIDQCRSKETYIQFSLFKNLKIPAHDLVIGLLYLSDKARYECEGNSWKDFVFSLSKFRSIQRHYNQNEYKKLDFEDAVHGNAWRRIKLELQYKAIDVKYRVVLEKIPELNNPFNPINIISNIERIKNKK